MSETLNAPWIADYLINIAETYGTNLTSVPVHVKPGKRVQLLRFLTFQDHTENDCVWAHVSDKHQQLPVRFSRHALAKYSKVHQPDSQGKRFTQQRHAIAIIKSFQPVFMRVPTGRVGHETIQETLALYVDDVQVVGGAGEPEFGSPRPLETHDDIKEWMEGLRAGDGTGNFLKLRKQRKIAEERGERYQTGTSVSHEKSGDARRSVQSNGNLHVAEQDDWREIIAKKPVGFFKRPSHSGTSALKSVATGANEERGNSESPIKPKTKHGKGALDLDSSPVNTRDIENCSPASLRRQTTPSEWPPSPSPERYSTPPSSPEPAGERPVSPPSTPPLFTPEQPQEAQGQEAPVAESTESSQAISTNDAEVTSLRPPTPAQRRRSMPPISSYPSSLSTPLSRTKATSLPLDVFGSSASNTRRVPLPTVKFNKDAYGEILVPSSDSGELVIQSSSHENPSALGPFRFYDHHKEETARNKDKARQKRVMHEQDQAMFDEVSKENAERIRQEVLRKFTVVASVPKHPMAPSSSPERVNDSYEIQSQIPEPERSQDPNGLRLEDLSRMALNGSYPEQLHGDDVQPGNRDAAHDEEAAKSPSPVPDPEPTLPPSSIPIPSQSPTWRHATTTVEETLAVEETPDHATRDATAKRARPSPSPAESSILQSKRPKLMSHKSLTPDRQRHGTTPPEVVFDAELLKLGIKANLADYDNSPPVFPWGEGMAHLNLRQPQHPLRITNSKLAEIWKNVCRSRGWCD